MLRWLTVLCITLVLALVGWRMFQKRADAAKEQKASAAQRSAPSLVETVPVTRRDVIRAFQAVGSVEAPIAVDLAPETTGRVQSLLVREGDRVRAGQALARIDPTELQAEVSRRQAALAQARARLAEAALTENAQGVGVSSAVRQQRSILGSAQALERKAKADYAEQIAAAEANVTAADGRIRETEAQMAQADASVARADAAIENARTALGRQETLLQKGFVAQQVVDNARTTLKVEEAGRVQAQQERRAAAAGRDSAVAQKQALERQVQLVRNRAGAEVSAAGAVVTQARAALDTANANTARAPAYAQNLAALRAIVEAAEADVRAARNRLNDTVLRSPQDGVVTRRVVDPGTLVSPNQTVLSVQAVNAVWAVVSLPEEVTRRIAQGQAATVTFDALPGLTFRGRVEQILPAADVQSRQFTARVRLDNRDGRVRSGTFGRVTFVVEKAENALTAPLEAVKIDPDKPGVGTVTVVEGDTARVREVRTGISSGGVVVLAGGVKEGEQVIVLSTRPVKDGAKVRAGGRDGGAERGGNGRRGGGANAPSQERTGQGRGPQEGSNRR